MRLNEGAAAPDPYSARKMHAAADWVGAPPSSEGLRLYLDVLRARSWIVVLLVAIAVVSAAAVVSRTEKVYAAEADLLITPIPDANESLFGLGLVSESGDPTRDAETLAQLTTTDAVARRVRSRLALDQSAGSILNDVSAEPVAQSSIVTITARADDAEQAARLANTFARAAIDVRTERLHQLLDSVIPRLRRQLNQMRPADTRAAESLGAKLEDLETQRLLPDPTLHLESRAQPPSAPIAPRPLLTIAAAFIGALVLGIGVVLAAHVLDTRIEREEDLRRYRIPILGRIPREPVRRRLGRSGPLRPDQLSLTTLDAFNRLASSLTARTDSDTHSSFVTGAGPHEGKTTTAICLAASLGSLTDGVLLLEGDSRRPSVAQAFALDPGPDLTDVVNGRCRLGEAVHESDRLPAGVRVVVTEPADIAAPAPVSPEVADTLVREAQELSNWLVVDGPALNYAPDLLPLAKRVDSLLLVVRLGTTRVRDLADLAELLVQQGITPDGFIVVGGKPRSFYYSPTSQRVPSVTRDDPSPPVRS
jgi:capsular polysaccharide biosynthesis protein/Mrp family chromosome partitioning ATPase